MKCGNCIPRWKGELPPGLYHDQSQISARFDRNHTVEPYITHRWPPDLSKTRARCGIGSSSANLPKKSFGGPQSRAFRGSDHFTAPNKFARDRSYMKRGRCSAICRKDHL